MIEETIPTGSTITYQGIDYTTESEFNAIKVEAPVEVPATDTTVDTSAAPIVAPEAPQPSTEDVTITPGETIEITEAAA